MKKMHPKGSRYWILAFALAVTFFVAVGCEPTDPPSTDPPSTVINPANTGAFTKCTYTSNLDHADYDSAEVFYPCQTGTGPFAATTLTGGWTNTKEDMYWLADHLVTHGYVIIAMTPNNNLGNNPQWTAAHKAGIAKLRSENTRTGSPIRGLVKTDALQIMGFSKGGGGALLASAELGSQIKSTQALAPHMDASYNLRGIRANTICHTGTNDSIVSPNRVIEQYNSLPTTIQRTLAYFDGVNHLDWMGSSGSHRDRLRTYVTGWMKVHLDDDSRYAGYIDGSQPGWFYGFAVNANYENGGGGCN